MKQLIYITTFMKNFLLYIFTISSFIFLNAQNTKAFVVNYDIYLNSDIPNIQNGKLLINSSKSESFFIISGFKRINDVNDINKNAEDNADLRIQMKSNKLRFVHVKPETDSLFSTSKYFSNNYLISESIPKIDWVLLDEEKNIDGFVVAKASATFRGRKYYAWYSTTYPLSFGPWKFNGLPGLIFEVYDETNTYRWIIKSIKKENDVPFNYNINEYNKISLKKYVEVKYNDDEITTFLKAKLPRGVKISSEEKGQRNDIELIYEWENNTKK
ncbi:GLPGLI family protein [Flaviramulus basaltis]|uniref:GLPGLI family protein n=1 Tax=Flaviramulus basaltis TaxID=369401 RepID=A0A1K2IDP7_9FLAO|nr:GLPGLI family protein [Flaviramulus basaltis]SFZ90556.1 GLPGLI family protein [Flaviramulus basaltis]